MNPNATSQTPGLRRSGDGASVRGPHEDSGLVRASFIGLLLLAIFTILVLVLPGLWWGLPSEARSRLTFGEDRDSWHVPEGASKELDDPWAAYPNYVRGGRQRTGAHPRSAFNVVRSYHPDEYAILKSLRGMSPAKFKFFHGFFGWPAFHFYVVGAALKLSSRVGLVRLEPRLDFYFQNPQEMARLYVVGRAVTLALAIGCIVALAWAAARLFGWQAGAAAGLLLAVTPLFAVNAHYMTADVPMLFWIALTLLASVHILRAGSRRWYVLAGVFLGLAAATRYQGALAAFLVLSAHVLRPADGASPERGNPQKWSHVASRLGSRNLWLAALVSILIFLAANPYILARPGQFWAELMGEARGSRNPMSALVSAPLFIESGFGVIFAGTAIAALGMALARRERGVLFVLLGFGIPTFLLCLGRPAMVRYLMPVVPLPVLLVAWAFARVHRRGVEKGKAGTRFAAPMLFAALLFVTGQQSWAFCALFNDPESDTRTRAGEWIAANIPDGATIGVVSEPWQFELPALNAKRSRLIIVSPDPQALAAAEPEFFVSSDLQFPPIAIRGPLNAPEAEFWAEVFESGGRYVVARRIEAWPYGRKLFLRHGPHDTRYSNPVIVIARLVKREPRRSGEKAVSRKINPL